jgi:hypothetical protein
MTERLSEAELSFLDEVVVRSHERRKGFIGTYKTSRAFAAECVLLAYAPRLIAEIRAALIEQPVVSLPQRDAILGLCTAAVIVAMNDDATTAEKNDLAERSSAIKRALIEPPAREDFV